MGKSIRTVNRPIIPIYTYYNYKGRKVAATGDLISDNSVIIKRGSCVYDFKNDKYNVLTGDIEVDNLESATKFILGKIDKKGNAIETVGKVFGFDYWRSIETGEKIGKYVIGNYRATEDGECLAEHNKWCLRHNFWYSEEEDENGEEYINYYSIRNEMFAHESMFDDGFCRYAMNQVIENFMTMLIGPVGIGKTQLSLTLPHVINNTDSNNYTLMISSNELNLEKASKKVSDFIKKASNDLSKLYFVIIDDGINAKEFDSLLGQLRNLNSVEYRQLNGITSNLRVIVTGDESGETIKDNMQMYAKGKFKIIRCTLKMNNKKINDKISREYKISATEAKKVLDIVEKYNQKLEKYKLGHNSSYVDMYSIVLKDVVGMASFSDVIDNIKSIMGEYKYENYYTGQSSIKEYMQNEIDEVLSVVA